MRTAMRMLSLVAVALSGAACERAGGQVLEEYQPRLPVGAAAVLVGAGDIGSCERDDDDEDQGWTPGSRLGVEMTGQLLDSLVGSASSVIVFTTGDNAYGEGSRRQFANCYDPHWGRHKSITRPAPGNHDYKTRGASGYFGYFGANAGPAGRGYYSYELGDWHIISLSSEISMKPGSAQERWLRADLAATSKRCVLAYWHEPRFSSGKHGSSRALRHLWSALFEYGAEVVINGHDHNYERFAPQTPQGRRDDARGIRQFVVGTGGRDLRRFESRAANSEVRYNETHGLLKLTLNADRYRWEFVPVSGSFRDTGSGTCH